MSEKKQTKNEMTMDDLARIVQNGFLELKSELKSDIKGVKSDLKSDIKRLENDIKEVKSDTEYIKAEVNKKVDKFEHNELVYRVEKLEKKFA